MNTWLHTARTLYSQNKIKVFLTHKCHSCHECTNSRKVLEVLPTVKIFTKIAEVGGNISPKGQAYLKGHDCVTKEGRKERNAYCKIHSPRNIWKIITQTHTNEHLNKHMLTNTTWGETRYKRSRCWNSCRYNELPKHTHEWELLTWH